MATYGLAWYLSQNLRAEAYGRFALVITLMNVITVFTVLGFDSTLIRYISEYVQAKQPSKIKDLYFKIIKIALPLSILFGLAVFFYSYLPEYASRPAWQMQIRTLGIAIPAFTLFQINNAVIIGLKETKVYGLFKNVLMMSLTFLLTFVISFHFLSISYAIISLCMALYLIVFFSTVFILRKTKMLSHKAKISLDRKTLWKVSYPMLLTTAMSLLITSVDILMLGYFESTLEVGLYDIAVKISIMTGIFLLAINSIAAPKFAAFFSSNDFFNLKRMVRWASKFIFLTTIPVLIFILLFPDFLLGIFGSEFLTARSALGILVIGQFIAASTGPVGNLLKMTNNQKIYQNIMIAAMILNVVLNFILIPIYSIEGAAMASAISISLLNIVAVIFAYRKLKLVSFYIPFFTR